MNPKVRSLKPGDVKHPGAMIFLAKGAEIVFCSNSKLTFQPDWILQAKNGLILHHYTEIDIIWLESNGIIKRKRRNYKERQEIRWVASNDLVRAIRTWPGQETKVIFRDGYDNLTLVPSPQ